MQNAADWGGGGRVFYRCEDCEHMLTYNFTTCANFTKCEKIGMKYVTHWYQFFTRCEELVPIFHSVKLMICEM